jgi:chromatin remodeling complex protein RSC6
MVRASKQSTPSAATVAPTPAVPATTEPKKSASKKAVAKSVESVAPSVEVSKDAPVNEVVAVVADDLVELLNAMAVKISESSAFHANLKTQFKALQKVVLKEHKTAQKVSNRRNKRSGNRKPSGFVRPCLVSDELATFLGKPAGSEMARTEVSKEINNYIRVNSLQDEKNGRQINADPKLSTLLKLQPGDSLTYFNLQRYMKHHFLKVDAPVVSETAPVVA